MTQYLLFITVYWTSEWFHDILELSVCYLGWGLSICPLAQILEIILQIKKLRWTYFWIPSLVWWSFLLCFYLLLMLYSRIINLLVIWDEFFLHSIVSLHRLGCISPFFGLCFPGAYLQYKNGFQFMEWFTAPSRIKPLEVDAPESTSLKIYHTCML